jgi:hypothetical protein
MKALRRVMGGLRSLFRRNREEQELDEELRGYLEMSAEHKMSAGINGDDAMRSARVEFGSLDAVKEQVRDVGWESFLETLWQDIRFAVRTLMKEPSFAAGRCSDGCVWHRRDDGDIQHCQRRALAAVAIPECRTNRANH